MVQNHKFVTTGRSLYSKGDNVSVMTETDIFKNKQVVIYSWEVLSNEKKIKKLIFVFRYMAIKFWVLKCKVARIWLSNE